MKLSKFSARHFRCLYDGQEIEFHPITVLIGENDGGKSATLDAMSIFFAQNKSPSDADYSFVNWSVVGDQEETDPKETEITLGAEFNLDEQDLQKINELLISPIETLKIRKVFNKDGTRSVQIRCQTPTDLELRIDPVAITLPQIRELSTQFKFEIPGGTSREPNLSAFLEWLRHQPTVDDWSIAPQSILSMMPEFELVPSSSDPESILLRLLSLAYRDELEKEDNQDLVKRLEQNLRGPLQDRASTLKAIIQTYLPAIEDVVVDPEISFDSGLRSLRLQLVGRDRNPINLSMRGQGLRQQVTLAVYEWSNGVLEKRQEEGGRPLILAFDEPDIHLDYRAQQHLYTTISRFSESNIQVAIATHSINFINRVPINQINHFSLSLESSRSTIETLKASDDPEELEFFLHHLGSNMGLDNSTMFYERCFLTVEGKTEEGALPRLFEICTGASTHARGVKLVNSENNHGAIVCAKFLHNNHRQVLFLVDEDTTFHKGTNRLLSEDRLFRADFPKERCHIVTPGCFEYAFSDDVWCRVLNEHQFEGSRVWVSADVAKFRTTPKEFIESIQAILSVEAKPRIGLWLAAAVNHVSEVPESIRNCLLQADELANPSTSA
ncbi:MAG: AAA family ATPase [Deltaproteobacteria bacterium]|nr:AAA family ATPase [Deltaproteobacteria bacterium]